MATDPLAELDAILANLGEPPQPKKRRQRQPSLLPDLSEAEVPGMLGNLANSVLSGVAAVGNVLDTPGSLVRGLLAGEPGRAFGGIFDPDQRVSGRELLQDYGLVGPNKPGLDSADVAGFAAEVIADPLVLVSGPGKALTKAGQAVAKTGVRDAAGKLLSLPGVTPLRRIDEIARGERGLIGFKSPFHPLSDPAVVLGTGPTAAKAAKWWYYNPVTRGFRKLFSSNQLLKGFDQQMQMAADDEWGNLIDSVAAIEETGVALRQKIPQLGEIFDSQIKDYLDANPQIKEALGGETFDPANVDEMLRMLGEYKAFNPGATEDVLERLGEMSKSSRTLQQILSAQPHTPQNIMEAAAHFDGVTNELLKLQDGLAGDLKRMGGHIGLLDDSYIGHMARRLNPAIIEDARKQFILQGGQGNRFSFWGGNKRREILKDIPGGTATLQRISRDPRLTASPLPSFATGKGVDPQALYERARILWDEYGIPRINRDAKFVDEQTDGLVKFFAELPPVALQTGLFGPDIATNALDYAIHAARVKGALSATHRLVQDTVTTDPVGPSIQEAFRALFPKGDSSEWATSHFINEYAKKNGLPDLNSVFPDKLYVPEPFIQTARKYLEFSRPDKVEGFLKFWDQANSLYKGSLYSPFPASHARNLVSGLWQNMVTAFTNPKVAGAAFKETFNILKGKPSKYTEEIKALGIGIDGILQEVTGTKAAGGIPSLPTMAGVAESFKGAKAPFQKGFMSIGNPLNPLNVRGVREGLEQGSQFPLFRAGEKAAEIVEFINRVSHYIARRETGYEPALAKLQTKAAHIDYASFSDFEKKVLGRVVPFYRFSRGNIALQLRHLMEAPGGRTAQTIRGINAVRDESDKNYVPRYLAEGLAIPMGAGSTPNTQRFFSSTGLLPVEEAFNRFAFDGGSPNVTRTLEKTGAQLHPILQTVLESMTGKELWSGRPLDSLYPFPTENDDVNYVSHKLPTARVQTLARTWLDERKGLAEKIVNTLVGGARVTDVDTEKMLAIEAKEVMEKILRGQKGVRSFERFYARPADQVEMSSEQLEQLALYQAILDELKRISEERATAKQMSQAQ